MILLLKSIVMVLCKYSILPKNLCDYLINVYETNSDNLERVDNESKPTFTQLNLNRYHPKVISNLCNYFSTALDNYKKDVLSAKYLPKIKLPPVPCICQPPPCNP